MVFELSPNELWFPEPEYAEDDGLLAYGGDLSTDRLNLAYRSGIFPWYSDNTPILWYSPHERFILFPEDVRISKTLRKVIRSNKFSVTQNLCFGEVIRACASVARTGDPGTWITREMQAAYIGLNRLGMARSIEVWYEGMLAGGLYGVEINNVFCGESMFSYVSDASKVALVYLCQQPGYRMIDCQVHTSHLESMGAIMISRDEYLRILNDV